MPPDDELDPLPGWLHDILRAALKAEHKCPRLGPPFGRLVEMLGWSEVEALPKGSTVTVVVAAGRAKVEIFSGHRGLVFHVTAADMLYRERHYPGGKMASTILPRITPVTIRNDFRWLFRANLYRSSIEE